MSYFTIRDYRLAIAILLAGSLCLYVKGAMTFAQPDLSYFPAPCIARHTCSAVSGVSRWRTPKPVSVSNTALATAAGAGTVDTDPIPFAPSGFVGEGTSSVSRMR